jgi:starch synthase (maltosyl-transferring)
MMSPLWVSAVEPCVDGPGRHAVKRIAGERCQVQADILRDGHALIAAVVKWRAPAYRIDGAASAVEPWQEAPLTPMQIGPGITEAQAEDRWVGEFVLERLGHYEFCIEAWTDRYGSWLHDLGKKVRARKDVRADRAEGMKLVLALADALGEHADAGVLRRYASLLQLAPDDHAAMQIAGEHLLVDTMARHDRRIDAATSTPLPIQVERERAAYGAWYELFPRSQGGGQHGSFATAAARLPEIADMGFDVVYLAPIYPIGRVNRKGRNNSLSSVPGDPGSPWAIGNPDGGFTSIEPQLGTIADFDAFVAKAAQLGLEVALDFAIQCAPDHPWVKEHPSWFFHRPDGTIKYAENPPKEYQDVYPIDFETAEVEALKGALRDVLLFWIGHGVRIFRVDNPHTKPIWFWEWLIADIQRLHPEVVFLAEAFTRQKVMHALAQVGFSQSYTYFTWRDTKADLTEYVTELSTPPVRDFFRPNFFANTPDILPRILQTGLPAAFKQRLVLAATLSPSYGIYSGYELCEGGALPHSEEYLDSEKYELKQRDFDAPGNLKAYIARVNAARRDNPALQLILPVTFLFIDNDQLLFFCKATPDRSNVILVAVNLDPVNPHHARCHVPPEVIGVPAGQGYAVEDLITGARYDWQHDAFVRLDPAEQPAHLFKVMRR